MAKTIVGMMENMRQAQEVVTDLRENRFDKDSINLIGSHLEEGTVETQDTKDIKKKDAARGAATGAGAGAAIGGLAGFVAGLTALTIPGIGPLVAMGPLAATLAGGGVGAVAGGIVGALTKMGVPEKDAQYYHEGIRRGGVLVTVAAPDDRAEVAASIMEKHGAIDIDRRSESWKREERTGTEADDTRFAGTESRFEGTGTSMREGTATGTNFRDSTTGEERVIPVVEEDLVVGKREVPGQTVRVYSHISEVPVEESVTLREEHATVERRPVDRPATESDMQTFREESVEVRETREEPVVSKQARVKEEVVVGKDATSRMETVRDTARKTDIEVERGATGVTGSPSRMEGETETVGTGLAGSRSDMRTGTSETALRDTGVTTDLSDDEDYRRHYQSTFGGKDADWETYRSAYHYADEDSEALRYRGRDFNEVEEDLHRSWDSSHPGTWARFKEAIRYGWNRSRRH